VVVAAATAAVSPGTAVPAVPAAEAAMMTTAVVTSVAATGATTVMKAALLMTSWPMTAVTVIRAGLVIARSRVVPPPGVVDDPARASYRRDRPDGHDDDEHHADEDVLPDPEHASSR